jgi:hypothetical protein
MVWCGVAFPLKLGIRISLARFWRSPTLIPAALQPFVASLEGDDDEEQ